jgi:hypothetical protein
LAVELSNDGLREGQWENVNCAKKDCLASIYQSKPYFMRRIAVLLAFIIVAIEVNAQPNHNGILRLYGRPHFAKLTDTGTLRWLKSQLDASRYPYLGRQQSPPNAATISDTTRWQLMYYHYYSEDGIIYSRRTLTNQFYVNRQPSQTATTAQILNAFGVKGKNRKLLDYYLFFIPGRFHDMGNRDYHLEWHPICISKDWLLLRMAHSYPDGNAVSYYKEYRYYFARR